MGKTKIAWTEESINFFRGCSRISPGCENCYAERMSARFSGPGHPYEGLTKGGKWTGVVRLIEPKLFEPLRWRRPRMVFVNSMSDLFHEKISDEDIDRVFAVMMIANTHVFQVLTKRAERMRRYMKEPDRLERIAVAAAQLDHNSNLAYAIERYPWPPRSVWLGVSVENQKYADRRIGELLETPAHLRFVSAEPLLGPINLAQYLSSGGGGADWLIAGCESGPGRRPSELAWFQDLADQCASAGVPYFLKQVQTADGIQELPALNGRVWDQMPTTGVKFQPLKDRETSQDQSDCSCHRDDTAG